MVRAVVLLFFIIAIIAISNINAVPLCGGENEIFNSCASSCPATCERPYPSVCTLACVPRCDCVNGFVRNYENKCVLFQQCDKQV